MYVYVCVLLRENYTFCPFLGGQYHLLENMCPWTEEPSGLESTGSQRIEHDWLTLSELYEVTTAIIPILRIRNLSLASGWGVRASQVVLMVKNPPANAGDIRKAGSIPGSERSSGEGMATHSSVLAWRIPWTEEPGGLQSTGSQESDT